MSLPIKIQLSEHFLDEEVRCETFIPSKRKKIWAIELDLAQEFIRVCEKYDLTWFAGFGTMLGAVRHSGFIPWDNDMDFIMPRKDFQKFCEVGIGEFKAPYYLKTPITENGRYFLDFAKIGNELTTGESEQEWLQGTRAGIFVDVFVLDEIPDNRKAFIYAQNQWHKLSHLVRFLSPYPRKDKGIHKLYHYIWTILWKTKYHSCKGDYLFREWDRIYDSMPGGRDMAVIGNNYGLNALDKSYWQRGNMMTFENLQLQMPAGYDTILRAWYHDYMQYPPIEKRVNHEYLDIEPEFPYKEYFSKKYGNK